jgi:hypothetical protein
VRKPGETLAESSKARAGTNPEREAPGRERRQVGTKTRRLRGGGSVGVLVGVTPHRGARESRVQGEAPKSEGSRSRATNRMQIWGNVPGEAGERRPDVSPSGVSRGMVKAICPVLTGSCDMKTSQSLLCDVCNDDTTRCPISGILRRCAGR